MGLINEDYLHGFISRVNSTIKGESIRIQNHLDRMDRAFNLMQGRMTLIGSTSGAGKSFLLDDLFILNPWRKVKNDKNVHWEVLYFSLERNKAFKFGRWIAWFLNRDHKKMISSDIIMFGNHKGKKINKELYNTIRSYDDEMSDLLDSVHVFDGRITTSRLARIIREKAQELGVFFLSDEIGVRRIEKGGNNEDYIAYFEEEKVRQTRVGPVQYVDLEYKGKKFTLTPNGNRYFPHHKKMFLFIVIDGIGLLKLTGKQSLKIAIDNASDILADARDMFGFSPVIVSQFNRSIADVQRRKIHGSSMGPNEADFKDSGNLFQAADLVLGLFDPYRFKAYDEEGIYEGYDIADGMMSPQGQCRFRSLHVLKSTYGIDGKMYGMHFTGEVGKYEVLPLPNDPKALERVYMRIAQGR